MVIRPSAAGDGGEKGNFIPGVQGVVEADIFMIDSGQGVRRSRGVNYGLPGVRDGRGRMCEPDFFLVEPFAKAGKKFDGDGHDSVRG